MPKMYMPDNIRGSNGLLSKISIALRSELISIVAFSSDMAL